MKKITCQERDDGFIAQEGNYYFEDELGRLYDNP